MEENKIETDKVAEKKVEPQIKINDNKQKIIWVAIIGFAVVVTVSIVGYAFYSWQKVRSEQLEANYQQQIRNLQQAALRNQQQQNIPTSVQDQGEGDTEYAEDLKIELDKIDVDWEKKLVEIKDDCEEGMQCYLVGKITNDDSKYKGQSLYMELSSTMGGYDIRHYVILKDDVAGNIKEYADGFGEEGNITITGVSDIPDEITFPGTNYRLKKYYSPSYLFSDEVIKPKDKLFTDKNLGDFYLTEGGCLVVELPDHTVISYDFIIPFVSEEDRVINVTFNDGKNNQYEYDYTIHSCGGVCTNLSEAEKDKINPENDLEVIGKTVNGEDIYRFKDQNNKNLKELYNDKNTIAYYDDDYKQQEKNRYTYSEFIKMNPYLFWKDPLDRWIEFENSKFSVAAEMCKPVVYLYPESDADLNLKLSLNGFLTKTDPTYNDGWKVSASPDGKIKNIDTNEYYDYLLWEGIGLDYPKQNEGWVVKKEDMDSFLSEKLKILGLNEKEAGDFKEYWLSRLREKPFYKISFLSRKQFDSLASLTFSPISPKVFIRVMMTAEGLDNYINIPEQKLSNAPERSGFTAVEWGGALLK